MIGIVLVSHSSKIAEGIRELAQQISQNPLPIAVAAGFDDPDNPLGTDAIRVMEAIQEVYHEDGVIIFMDLGGALISTETALDLLPEAWKANIYLSSAPMIEGAVMAAVHVSIGHPITTVLAEAHLALNSKHAHLKNEFKAEFNPSESILISPDAKELKIVVPNQLGLHARPAANIVKIASRYKATLIIRKNLLSANAHSINQIAMLGARQGDYLTFIADGEDDEALLHDIQAFTNNNFGDSLQAIKSQEIVNYAISDHPAHIIRGIPASKGVAIGEVYQIDSVMPTVSAKQISNVDLEKARLQFALNAVASDLKHLATTSKYKLGVNEASIFDAQILILQDPDLLKTTHSRITQDKLNAEFVWWHVIQDLANRYSELEDTVLSDRALDVRDVGRRVLQKLSPELIKQTQPDKPCIVVASELSPSDVAELDGRMVLGIVMMKGGVTSHSAIIARALGVPAVIGVGKLHEIQQGQVIAVDGDKGWIWTKINEEEQSVLQKSSQQWSIKRDQIHSLSKNPAMTQDGHPIKIVANIGKPDEAIKAVEAGAEGVGLFRTELLFMDRDTLPSEDEQYEAYALTAKNLNGQLLTIRTVDIGGDKPIKYIPFDFEANPFLGYRGIRYWLDSPDICRTQIRAIYRASAHCNLQLMLPMVSTQAELNRAKQIIKDVCTSLDKDGIAYDPTTSLGIMIEVPSAVFIADQLAQQVDFFSIGTNDLTQYIMAADRSNAQLYDLVDYFQPSVIRAIKHVVDAAHKANISVSMCGEMAGDTIAIPLLIALGIDKLSMNAPTIPEVKSLIRSLSRRDLKTHIAEVLSLTSSDAIRSHLKTLTNLNIEPT